jgi:hypothetical protein
VNARKVASPAEGGRVALQNRLPAKHAQRLALETAVGGALAGLEGRWDVVLEAPDALTLLVTVIAPDGSAWNMSCNPALRDPEWVAASVRTACNRRRWLKPGKAAGVKAKVNSRPAGTPATGPGGKST